MTKKRRKLISYSYLVSCTVPLLSVICGIVWASGQQGFDSWGIVFFLLFGGAFGVVNVIAGAFVISMQDNSLRLRVFIGIGFLLGGIVPTLCLLFLLSQF